MEKLYCMHCAMPIKEDEELCPSCGNALTTDVPQQHLMVGTVLNGRYYTGKSMGQGGFGVTYVGRDLKLNRKVAIKEYFPNGCVSRTHTISLDVEVLPSAAQGEFFEKGCQQFLREARILAQLGDEPGVVGVHDFFQENNTVYIVMDFLTGQTLKDYLLQNGVMSPKTVVAMLTPVMLSLAEIHKKGLIHRDISPDNIMLCNGTTKLLDFGAARDVSGVDNKSLSVMLKAGYAPEEQYRSRGNQGPWTDVYALCASIYKCVTGITLDDATQRVFSDEIKKPSELGVKIDDYLETALMKGLSVRQENRYQDMLSLLNALSGRTSPNPAPLQSIASAATDAASTDKKPAIQAEGQAQAPVVQQDKAELPRHVANFETLAGQEDIPPEETMEMAPIADAKEKSKQQAHEMQSKRLSTCLKESFKEFKAMKGWSCLFLMLLFAFVLAMFWPTNDIELFDNWLSTSAYIGRINLLEFCVAVGTLNALRFVNSSYLVDKIANKCLTDAQFSLSLFLFEFLLSMMEGFILLIPVCLMGGFNIFSAGLIICSGFEVFVTLSLVIFASDMFAFVVFLKAKHVVTGITIVVIGVLLQLAVLKSFGTDITVVLLQWGDKALEATRQGIYYGYYSNYASTYTLELLQQWGIMLVFSVICCVILGKKIKALYRFSEEN